MTFRKTVLLSFFVLILALSGCLAKNQENKKIIFETAKDDASLSLNKYYSDIDYSCRTDSDCEIKDIGSCCGYYPQCVNTDAETDSELVKELCKKEGAASICGFESITSCQCVNKRCESK